MQWLWWLFGLCFYNLSIGCLFCCSCPIHDCWLLCGYSGPLEVQQKYVNAHQQYEVNSVKRFKKIARITYAFSENSNYGRERCKGKKLLDDANKFLNTKSLLIMPSNVLPLRLKQTFPPIIWIFNWRWWDQIYLLESYLL